MNIRLAKTETVPSISGLEQPPLEGETPVFSLLSSSSVRILLFPQNKFCCLFSSDTSLPMDEETPALRFFVW